MVRSSTEIVEARVALTEEMAGGDLGDARLNARRDRLIEVLEQHPDVGFPDACASESESEALYRFLRNPRVSLAAVIEPHVQATCDRCRAIGEVLVIHDTTEQVFPGEHTRAGLTRLGPQRHGFWMHAALTVSAEGLRAPLGLLSVVPFVRTPGAAQRRPTSRRARYADPDKEQRRWHEGVAAVRARFGDEVAAIHVMDREGDSYALFADLIQHGDRFVIRLKHERRLATAREAGAPDTLTDAVPRTDWLVERTISVSPRPAGDRPQQARQRHPTRAGRQATLRFGRRQLVLKRSEGLAQTPLPRALTVHVVFAWEVDPPYGEAPIEWRLITTEPVDTAEQVLRIVDWYRTRWLIEEFFKCLKTGCAYEKRQLESLDTLLVALALLAPIAWQLLLMRHLARQLPEARAAVALTARQIAILRTTPGGTKLVGTPAIRDALLVVARLGGHLRQNGEPGWLVLARGMQKLLCMETGWVAAEAARCDQS